MTSTATPVDRLTTAPPTRLTPRDRSLTYEEYREVRCFRSLDGIRCLCILAVLWHHSVGGALHATATSFPGADIFRRGFLGVNMFFVLSGFLIVTLLQREYAQHRNISLRHFYARRTLRIFPIYYLLVLGTAIYTRFLPDTSSVKETTNELFFFLITYTANFAAERGIFAHLWSLSVEEQFYLIWPPIEKWLRPLLIPLLLLLVFGTALADSGHLLQLATSTESTFLFVMLRGPLLRAIVWGVLLAHLLHDPVWYARLRALLGGRWASAIVLALLLACIAMPGPREPYAAVATHVLMTAFLATCLVRPDHPLSFIFDWKPVAYVGMISYGMYLYHMHVRHLSTALLARFEVSEPLALFPLMTTLTIGLAAISYHCLESRVLRYRQRFTRSATGHEASSQSALPQDAQRS